MVRLVIVFLQNILKSKIISLDAVCTDIKHFCIENNMIKECQDMMKKVIAEEGF